MNERLVPDWLENLAALSWRVLAVAAFVVVLAFIAAALWTVTASVAVAIVIAAVFAPFVLRLRDRGRSRNAAAGAVWLTAVLVIGGMVLVIVVSLLPHIADLAASLRDGLGSLERDAADLGLPPEVVRLASDVADATGGVGDELIGRIANSVIEMGTILVLAAFLVFFFLRDGDKAWLWCFQSLAPERRELITSAGNDALERVGGYLRGTTVLAAIVSLTNYLFMLLLGLPLVIPLALLSFVATYIPYFGGIIVTAAILVVAYGAGGTGTALLMLLLLSVRTFLVGYFVRPLIYGRTVHLHPALVLLVLPAGFQLGGVVGLFAAVPVTAVVMTVAQSAIAIIAPDPPPKLPELVPAWLDRAAQWSWRALVAIALIALLVLVLTTMPLVVLPVILGLIFAATLQPAAAWLVRHGSRPGTAAAIATVGASVAIAAVLVLALASLVDQVGALADTTVAATDEIDQAASGHLELLAAGISRGTGALVDTVVTASRELAGIGTVLLLAVLLTFYLLLDGARWWTKLMAHTRGATARDLDAAGARAFGVLGGYMTGTAAISFVGAFSQLVIMVVLALPLALPVFVLSFFGGFIPYIGSALTTGLALLIAVAVGDTVDIVVMLVWTLLFNVVQGNIVAPLVYNRTTHIHPAIVLAAIPAGAAVAGILGMFLVVPVLGVVAATWRSVLRAMGSGTSPGSDVDDAAAVPAAIDPADGGDVVTERGDAGQADSDAEQASPGVGPDDRAMEPA